MPALLKMVAKGLLHMTRGAAECVAPWDRLWDRLSLRESAGPGEEAFAVDALRLSTLRWTSQLFGFLVGRGGGCAALIHPTLPQTPGRRVDKRSASTVSDLPLAELQPLTPSVRGGRSVPTPPLSLRWRRVGVILPLLMLVLTSAPCSAATLPQTSAVPGGIALIPLGATPPGTVRFEGGPVMVLPDAGQYWAVVGIPLTQAPGEATLTLPGGATLPFAVATKDYPTQSLTVPNSHHVNPTAEELVRIRNEASALRRGLDLFSADHPAFPLAMPVQGVVSSPFGLRRIFNGEPRKPHSGLDLAADEGSEIRAPAAGVVVLTGNQFFNGNTVLLDHGQGLVTFYGHMSRIDVKVGQAVVRGQVLGRVGHTGRATGPHLHWGVSLNGVMVDPRLVTGEWR